MAYLGQSYNVAEMALDDEREHSQSGDTDFGQDMGAIDELRSINSWVGWKYVDRPGASKPTKPPVNPHTGRGASHSNPSHWGSHKQAEMAKRRYGLVGVGFVLSERDDITGIDLDNCRDKDTGELAPWVEAVIALGETYAEVSPSGRGVRLFARGKVEAATKCDPAGVEIYGLHRYMTVTEDHIEGTPIDIRPAPGTLEMLLSRAEAMRPAADPAAAAPHINTTPRPAASQGASGGEFFRNVNDKALQLLGMWVPVLCPGAKYHASTGAYRVSSKDLGRSLMEDLSFHPDGIKDHGVADMGDANQGRRSPIDSVIEYGGAPDAIAAAKWLCQQLGKTPESFGWSESAPHDEEISQIGNQIAEGLISRRAGERFDPDTGEFFTKLGATEPPGGPSGGASGAPPLVKATPYPWPDCTSIPPRQWLFGQHLIRKFVAVTGAPGGVGKTSLLCAEALSMVSGRPLLQGVAPVQPLNVWLWNGEDPLEEIYRRVAAAAKFYGITQADCEGQLFVDSGRATKIVIAETNGSKLVIARPIVDAVKQKIRECKIDVLVVDPFVSSHRVPENDNTLIDAVAREWAMIADETDCAIELIHHVRKIGDAEVTVEALRGGSALVSACRSARVLNQMSKEEADKAGVENRRAFFRVDFGKSNMTLVSGNALWHQMKSVDLGNRGPLMDGDSIGVVADWKWPNPLDEVTAKDLAAVQVRIAGGEWRENAQAKDWAGHAVADVLGLDMTDKTAKEKVKGLLKIWIKNRALVVVRRADKNGDERPFIEAAKQDDEAE